MIIPHYWAEGRAQQLHLGKQITVRRFGWSNHSDADAQAMADQRAQQALERIVSGEKLERRETKSAYNGADGVPIREEIISEHGDAVVTRNAYGARCLNTPNVFFADLDCEPYAALSYMVSIFIALWVGSVALARVLVGLSWPVVIGLLMLSLFAPVVIASVLEKRLEAAVTAKSGELSEGEQAAKANIQDFLDIDPAR